MRWGSAKSPTAPAARNEVPVMAFRPPAPSASEALRTSRGFSAAAVLTPTWSAPFNGRVRGSASARTPRHTVNGKGATHDAG